MPLHDLGYRSWEGRRTPAWRRSWSVAATGAALIWNSRWLRAMLVLAWIPMLAHATVIFLFEYWSAEPEYQRLVVQLLRGPLDRGDLVDLIRADPTRLRREVWSTVILGFFRYPQLFAMVLLLGMMAPRLISYDLRSRAYLLYFSRPLTPLEYLAGKAAVIWFFLALIATLPALLLYVLGVLLSPELAVAGSTWDLPPRILAASVALMLPTSMVALAYASLTAESRYAMFAWFATWGMGFVAYQVLTYVPVMGRPGRRRELLDELVDADRWRLVSPYHTLGKVQSWLFDLDRGEGSVAPALVLLAVAALAGGWIVQRRFVQRLSA
jgi:hypothetical protein